MRLGVPPHPIGPVGPDRPGRHFQTRQVPVERRSGPCRPDSECGPEHSAARVSGPLPLTRDAECGGALHFEGGSPIRQERGREWHRCGRSGMSAMEEMRNGIDDCPTLLALALPYAGHPDYRDEWKP
ncbi:MAG TPA: DUF6221 family protein [Thermobifida alba]|nr:DUF6221 family protein [Thermobifida alba]